MAKKKKQNGFNAKGNPIGRPLTPAEKLARIKTSSVLDVMKNGVSSRTAAGTRISIVSGGKCSPK